MAAVRTVSIPKAAAVSPVPLTVTNHISAGMITSMAKDTTRRLASPPETRGPSEARKERTMPGARKARPANGRETR